VSRATTVLVRVRPDRALTLRTGDGSTTLYRAGNELTLPADEAEALDEYVEPASAASLTDELELR
jgi:hypothetical protein